MQNLKTQLSNSLLKGKIFSQNALHLTVKESDINVLGSINIGNSSLNHTDISTINVNNLQQTNTQIINDINLDVNQLTINDSIKSDLFNLSGGFKILGNYIYFDQDEEYIYNNTDFGFKFKVGLDKYIKLYWDNTEECFKQSYDDDSLAQVLFNVLSIQNDYIKKSGDVMLGYLNLPLNIAPTSGYHLLTKSFIDQQETIILNKNHDSKYISITGRNMEDTEDIYFDGRQNEQQALGPIKIINNPISQNHIQNVNYLKHIRDTVVLQHKHNTLYQLRKQDFNEPILPTKTGYLQLGKDQQDPDEILKVGQVKDYPMYHEHEYLWNSSGISESGELVDGTQTYKNRFGENTNLNYQSMSEFPIDQIHNQSQIVRYYVDKQLSNFNVGKLFFGWYDYQKGNSISESKSDITISMLGWFNYYKEHIDSSITPDKFLVVPFITMKDFITPNKMLVDNTPINVGDIQNQRSYTPYTGYHGVNKSVFGHFTYPNQSIKYTINLKLYSTAIEQTSSGYTETGNIQGSFQNFRIMLMGGVIDKVFKYYTFNQQTYLQNQQSLT